MAHIGVDGLSGLTLQWHDWSYSDQDISPMPLNEAITMANSTRESDTVLYYAGLIYSNWLSENDDLQTCAACCRPEKDTSRSSNTPP